MKRLIPLAAVAALLTPALPALAQTHVAATHGALAGRSPHQAYRQIAATPSCGKQMHSLPAGKLPTYGLHAHGQAGCSAAVLARTDKAAATRTGE